MLKTLTFIYEKFGEEVFRDGDQLLKLYLDLNPLQKAERQKLDYLVKCNGNVQLLDAKNCTYAVKKKIFLSVITRLTMAPNLSEEDARDICSIFWAAIGEKPINYSKEISPQGSGKKVVAIVAAVGVVLSMLFGLAKCNANNYPRPSSGGLVDNTTEVDVIEMAAQHVSEGKYLQAIHILDEEWKKTQDPRYYDAMAQYRLEFGVYNTSQIAAGKYTTALCSSDGYVMVFGDDDYDEHSACDWLDIVAISAGDHHIVGLQSDGTVITAGRSAEGLFDASYWTDVAAIYAGDYHTVAVFEDGSIGAVGRNKNGQCDTDLLTMYQGQEKAVAVSAGSRHTLVLLESGRVIACGDNFRNACDVSGWTDIAAIYTGSHYSVGLKTDGTIVAAGMGTSRLDPEKWTDLVNLAAGDFHLIGQKSDGTIITALLDPEDHPEYGQTEVWNLHDVTRIVAGFDHTVVLCEDGSIWCMGLNEYGQCEPSGMRLQ